MGSSYLRMGWLTSGLSLGLIVAICSVHRHDTVEETSGQGQGKVEDTLNIDLNDMMNMAKKYLGEDGVAKLINGDYSEIEREGRSYLIIYLKQFQRGRWAKNLMIVRQGI